MVFNVYFALYAFRLRILACKLTCFEYLTLILIFLTVSDFLILRPWFTTPKGRLFPSLLQYQRRSGVIFLCSSWQNWSYTILITPHIDPDDGDRASLRNVGFNPTLTHLIAREHFMSFICRESFVLHNTSVLWRVGSLSYWFSIRQWLSKRGI
jgi:hypothetical protein